MNLPSTTTISSSRNGKDACTTLLVRSLSHQSIICLQHSFNNSGVYRVADVAVMDASSLFSLLLIVFVLSTFFLASSTTGVENIRASTLLNSSGTCVASAPTSTAFAIGPSEPNAFKAAWTGDSWVDRKIFWRRSGVGVATSDVGWETVLERRGGSTTGGRGCPLRRNS